MKIDRWFMVASLALACGDAYGANWKALLTIGGDLPRTLYIDIASFSRQDDIVTIWERWVMTPPILKDGFEIAEIRTYIAFRCETKQYAEPYTEYFDGLGRRLHEDDFRAQGMHFKPIAEDDTIHGAAQIIACGLKSGGSP
jgi:hypothetical protein